MMETRANKNNMQSFGILLVLISTLALSTEAIAAKLTYRINSNILEILTARYLISAILFWIIMIKTKRTFISSLSKLPLVIILALGGQSLAVLALFYAFSYIPAAMAILFLYLYPTIVTIMAYFLLQESLTWRKWSALIFTLIGCTVILGQPLNNLDLRGVSLALLAAVLNAVFIVFSTRCLAEIPLPVFSAFTTSTSAIFYLILSWAGPGLTFAFSAGSWLAIIYLAVICTVVPMLTLFKGIKIIGASRASIISTCEPVFTAITGYFLLKETLTNWQLIGGVLVLAGVLLQREE